MICRFVTTVIGRMPTETPWPSNGVKIVSASVSVCEAPPPMASFGSLTYVKNVVGVAGTGRAGGAGGDIDPFASIQIDPRNAAERPSQWTSKEACSREMLLSDANVI